MTYNRIISKYLSSEESYLYKKEKGTLTRNEELKYYGFKMGLIDFIYAFADGYTEEQRDEYIQRISDVIAPILSDNDSINEELKIYYGAYKIMLDLISIVSAKDYKELSDFIRNNTKYEEGKLKKQKSFKKIKKKSINEIVNLVNKTYLDAHERIIFVHIGSDIKKRTNERQTHNVTLYKILIQAINDGLNTSDINYVDSMAYAKKSMISEAEYNKYYKGPCNFVASLTEEEKTGLMKRLGNKI